MKDELATAPGNRLAWAIPLTLFAIGSIAAAISVSSKMDIFGPSLEVTREDMGIAAALEITNKGRQPIVINEIQVNGRDRKECITKPNARFDVGGSYRMGVAYYFCGKVVRILVKTNHGDQEFSW